MNTLSKTLFGATAAAALAIGAASPAAAQYYDDDGIDGGDILTGALIFGGIAAAVAIATDDDDDDYDDRYGRYPSGGYGYGNGGYDYGNGGYGNGGYGNGGYGNGYGQAGLTEQQAINRCSNAAVQQARARYGNARVTQVTDIDRDGQGWDVDGRILVNEGRRNGNDRYNRWNARTGRDLDQGRFSCSIRYGRVDDVRISGI